MPTLLSLVSVAFFSFQLCAALPEPRHGRPVRAGAAVKRNAAATCNSTFDAISATDFVAALNPGWNLGNTLDAIPTEGSWNNAPVVPSTFDDVKAAGFKSVRLPVTWADHFNSSAPSYTVDPAWLQRVSDVVDMVTSRDLYTIVNVHHDSWEWADVTASGANLTMIEEKLYALWYQIGTKLACKPSNVAFETINEPPGDTAEAGAEINRLNEIMVQAIGDAGGFNAQRVVTLVGLGEDGAKTSTYFQPPANITNPWALQYHYYSPYDFIFSAWGDTLWGSDADKAAMEADLAAVRGNFTDVPLVIGEFSASPTNTETAARWKYFDFFVRTAAKYNTSVMLWDNGEDFLDRSSHTWRDETVIDILMNANEGVTNALPDSTEDATAPTQWTSAYIWLKQGDTVTDQTLPFLMANNSLMDIRTSGGVNATILKDGVDFDVSGDNVTFTSSSLTSLIGSSATNGIKANLTLSFMYGADLLVQVVQWAPPALVNGTSTAVSSVAADADLYVPITWNGLEKPAAVRAVTVNGTIVVDSWTEYLGPLQEGYTTYSSQWSWDEGDLIVTASMLQSVSAVGQDTVLTIDGWPRVVGNSVNYTLAV